MIALSPSTALEQLMRPGTNLSSHSSGSRPAHNLSAKGDRRSGLNRRKWVGGKFADVRIGSRFGHCSDVRCKTAFPPKAKVHPRSCDVAKAPGRDMTSQAPGAPFR